MKNPISAAANLAKLETPHAEPHAKNLHTPTHKQKVKHKGRPQVEMKRGHGMRKSAKGRDLHRASDIAPKLPGLKEPKGVQKIVKGSTRFPDQGRGGM